MYVECSGPGGGGSRCSFKRIAKVGARVREGERVEPPVMEVCVALGAQIRYQIPSRGVCVCVCVCV